MSHLKPWCRWKCPYKGLESRNMLGSVCTWKVHIPKPTLHLNLTTICTIVIYLGPSNEWQWCETHFQRVRFTYAHLKWWCMWIFFKNTDQISMEYVVFTRTTCTFKSNIPPKTNTMYQWCKNRVFKYTTTVWNSFLTWQAWLCALEPCKLNFGQRIEFSKFWCMHIWSPQKQDSSAEPIFRLWCPLLLGMRSKEIGLHVQNMITILGSHIQHNWVGGGDLYNHSMNPCLITLMMDKIFIQAPKTTTKGGCRHDLNLLTISYKSCVSYSRRSELHRLSWLVCVTIWNRALQ